MEDDKNQGDDAPKLSLVANGKAGAIPVWVDQGAVSV